MEPSDSWITYWWAVIPIAALAWFAYALMKSGASRSYKAAVASLSFGLAGLLFCPFAPFAIYFGRKAKAFGVDDASVTIMSRIGVVLGVLGCVFLAIALLIFGIYFYAWFTGQYPYNQVSP